MQKTLLGSQLEHGNPGTRILLQRTSAIPSEKAKGYLIVFKKTMHSFQPASSCTAAVTEAELSFTMGQG